MNKRLIENNLTLYHSPTHANCEKDNYILNPIHYSLNEIK